MLGRYGQIYVITSLYAIQLASINFARKSWYYLKDDINGYFTDLRIVWDEYKNTQPVSWCTYNTCRCHSATKWRNHQEEEPVMQFPIELNASYSQIRSHILYVVPLTSHGRPCAISCMSRYGRRL